MYIVDINGFKEYDLLWIDLLESPPVGDRENRHATLASACGPRVARSSSQMDFSDCAPRCLID